MVFFFTSDRTVSSNDQSHSFTNLASSDYLGLSADPQVISSAVEAVRKYGLGFAMNQPFATTDLHMLLRNKLSSYFDTEDALLFNSCTSANIALITTLHLSSQRDIIIDAGCHTSTQDGCVLGGDRVIRYRSRDAEDFLQRTRNAKPDGPEAIITDGIFSINGSIAPIDELLPTARAKRSFFVIDESHSAGVVGPGGLGCTSHFRLNVRSDNIVLTGTFAKAFGSGGGGYIAGPAALMDEIKRLARFYTFNTGMHMAAVGAAVTALDLALGETSSRVTLHTNVTRLRANLAEIGFVLENNPGAITSIPIGDERKAREIGLVLQANGFFVTVVAPPIVSSPNSSIRIQCSSKHSADEIDRFSEILAGSWRTSMP